MGRVRDRLAHAWNALVNEDKRLSPNAWDMGPSYTESPGRSTRRGWIQNDKTILNSIYNRLAIDAAAIQWVHAKMDEDGRYIETMKSGINNCFFIEANIDQAARAFRQDVYLSLFEEGYIAIVPIDTTIDPENTSAYDVLTMRVGLVEKFHPGHVTVTVFNESKGLRQSLTLRKDFVSIVYNPFFSVMNEPSSTLQRLIQKLRLLDVVDEASASGKLDLIIQLPYAVRSDDRKVDATRRREEISYQLKDSKYGIAWTDVNEKVTQLNRPTENQMMAQIEYLIALLYTQLGLTAEIMNGTADEATMLNYYHRTIEPIVNAPAEAMTRSWLSKTARTQGQTITYFYDPFKFVTLKDLAEIVDKFTRSEVATSNELRQKLGWKPSKDPKADELRNTNMPRKFTDPEGDPEEPVVDDPESVVDELDVGFDDEVNAMMQSGLTAESFLDYYLQHAGNYDAVKAHEYYMRTRKLKGKDKGGEAEKPRTRKAQATSLAVRAGKKVDGSKQRQIQRLADEAKIQLEALTQEIQQWRDSHPKATDKERWAKRDEVISQKDLILEELRTAVSKIVASPANDRKVPTATEGRHH